MCIGFTRLVMQYIKLVTLQGIALSEYADLFVVFLDIFKHILG
jgi:hypothetical protein